MASDYIWTDATANHEFDNTLNWNMGVVPVGGDTAIYTATYPGDCTVNCAAQTSEDLAEIVVQEGYPGDIGSSGEPLELSAGLITFRGSGTLYFKNGDTADTDDLIIDTANGAAFIGCNSAKIDRITILRGTRVTLQSTLTGTANLFCAKGTKVDIQGANTIKQIHADKGAIITSLIPLDYVDLMGAMFTQFPAGGAHSGCLSIGSGAECVWMTSATVASAIVYDGGVLNFEKDGRPKTLTTGRVFPGGRIRQKGVELAITNGGSLQLDNADIL